MKIKLVVLMVVLAALLLPGPGRAIFEFCSNCQKLGSGAGCTCPSFGPPYHFTTCNNYPAGCPFAFTSSGAPPPEKSAADSSYAQQDQAFLHELAQPAQAPKAEATSEVPLPFAPLSLCNQVSCNKDSDCYAACGGIGNTYCDRGVHRCNFL
jgi:hypothetical protein